MKKFSTLLFMLFIFLISGCSTHEVQEAQPIEVEPTDVSTDKEVTRTPEEGELEGDVYVPSEDDFSFPRNDVDKFSPQKTVICYSPGDVLAFNVQPNLVEYLGIIIEVSDGQMILQYDYEGSSEIFEVGDQFESYIAEQTVAELISFQGNTACINMFIFGPPPSTDL